MAFLFLEDTTMNPRRFELDAGAPAKNPARRQPEDTAPTGMRAAPEAERDERSSDQSMEEPGYGHGV